MKFNDLFEQWGLTGLSLDFGFVSADFEPADADKNAAWELYVEFATRVTTQELKYEDGKETAALESLYKLFGIARDIIKVHGRKGQTFAVIAFFVLNNIIRPFTAKWHPRLTDESDMETKTEFREDLKVIQKQMLIYTKILARIAGVEDMTKLIDLPEI